MKDARIEKPGIYRNMASDIYFADPCPEPSFTQSLAKIVLEQSPLHAMYEHPRLKPPAQIDDEAEKYEKVKAIGNAAHKILIQRGKDLAIEDFADWKSGDARKAKAKAIAEKKEPILAHHYAQALHVVKAARQQLDEAGWNESFVAGDGEVVLCWQEDGLWFRTMIDWLSPDQCVCTDYKTSGLNYAPFGIGRHMVAAGWDVQAAMHERGLNALDPANAKRRKFRFAAQENYAPFALVPIELNDAWLTMGRKKLEMAIAAWRDAMDRDCFDAYGSHVVHPEYPGWEEARFLDREIKDEARKRMPQKIDPQVLMAG
jgi:hypothetical protein